MSRSPAARKETGCARAECAGPGGEFRFGLYLLFFLLFLCMPALARGPGNEDQVDDPYDHLALAERALDGGRVDEACSQFQMALAFNPHSSAIVQKLLQVTAGDSEAQTLWSHAWYGTAADAEGHARPSRDQKSCLAPNDPLPSRIALARADAVSELVSFAAKCQVRGNHSPEDLLVAWWARRLALELSTFSSALEQGPCSELEPVLRLPPNFHAPVIAALQRVMKQGLSNKRIDQAVRAARCLRGLGVQAGFKDLKGPRPKGMKAMLQSAVSGLARARSMMDSRIGEPWTVEALDWLYREEGEAFTRDHSSFSEPGVAVSPEARYRIETDCGFETLHGVARTVEHHHNRLKNWFGVDPFLRRQGVIRIVPEAHGLESEGAPFWWAGGFQSGDLTVVRMSCGTIEGLGRGLTHELTHRFDGAVYPGMPAWLMEGRAVWTGAAYGTHRCKEFVPKHVSFGTMESAYLKGYGGKNKLLPLIDGSLEEYRDNYVAGYALYVYLAFWEDDGRPLYADRLEAFMKGARKGAKNRKAWFLSHFADGKQGRPGGIDAFAAAFHEFLRGFYWKTRQPWTDRFKRNVPGGGDSGFVYDEPTWTWSRVRAEPFFGQDHAREAGKLFLDLGRDKEGIRALVWALAVDGRTPEVEKLLSDTLKRKERNDAAWVMAHQAAFPNAGWEDRAPFLTALRKMRIYAEGIEEAVGAYSGKGLKRAAAVLAADHDRLAAWLGLSQLPSVPVKGKDGDSFLHPFDRCPRQAGFRGWKEDDLTGYEERRVPNLWYVTAHRDLHVGRRSARKGTGQLDRSSHKRHAFARSDIWLMPGTYRITARIKFTTSYTAGSVVFGYSRRDRNVRFRFSAGNLMYAIGESEDQPLFETLNWDLNGLWERDGVLPGSVSGGVFEFERAMPAFDLELLVDGAAVQASINGKPVGRYHTVDGTPIEGYLGFATSFGAICVQRPLVERLDRSLLAGRPDGKPLCLDLERGCSVSFEDLRNLPLRGIPPSSNGTLLVWIPVPWIVAAEGETVEPDWIVSQARKAAQRIHRIVDRKQLPQPWAVAVPAALGEGRVEELRREFEKEFENTPRVVTHTIPGWTAVRDPETADRGRRWLLFVDSGNIVRIVTSLTSVMAEVGFDDQVSHWLTVFRDHGRPARNLPTYSQRVEEEEAGEEDPDEGKVDR